MKSFIARQEPAERSDIRPVSIMILFHYIYRAVSFPRVACDFKPESLVYPPKYPREIITYLGGIIPSFIEYSEGISFAKSIVRLAISNLNH
jgi:hypothetical protein